MGTQNLVSEMETQIMEEIILVARFGDEQSTLLDQYERLSFEVQLNKAMLGRSLSSEPAVPRYNYPPPPLVAKKNEEPRRGGRRFHKVMKKLLSPIIGSNSNNNNNKGSKDNRGPIPNAHKDPILFWKTFRRSLRV